MNNDVQAFLRGSKSLNLKYDPEDFYPGKVILITKNDSFLNVDNGDVGFVAFDSDEGKAENRLKVFFPPKINQQVTMKTSKKCDASALKD